MTRLAYLIAQEEGFFRSGTIPAIRHNPGDLRHSPHSQHPGNPNDIGTIDNDADGWADLERQLLLDAQRGLTLQQAIFEWAPASDGNDPTRYLSNVLAGFAGAVTAETLLTQVLTIPFPAGVLPGTPAV
jgi:hypothetical protein